jgi:hypothetical protein
MPTKRMFWRRFTFLDIFNALQKADLESRTSPLEERKRSQLRRSSPSSAHSKTPMFSAKNRVDPRFQDDAPSALPSK